MQTETIIAARLFLARERPYLSMALWALYPVKVEGMNTFAVDEYWRLYYDPALDWDVKVTAAVLYHEINHLLRTHPERGKGLDVMTTAGFSLWNIAGDAEINDDVASEGIWNLPDECVYPSKLPPQPGGQPDGLMAEEYYNSLLKNADKVDIGGGDGEGEGSDGDGQGQPSPGAGNCGSAAGGGKRPWEQEDIPGARKISQAEGKLIGRKVAEDIQKHQKSRGDVPGHLQRWADAIINPKVDWRKELKAQIINAVAEVVGMWNYTYRRPGRRSSATPDIVMPAMTEPTVKVAVVVDTSGSMGQDELDTALGEIKGILDAVGVRDGVEVIACDAAVTATKKVFSAKQVNLAGGGGTDMRVGMEAATALRSKPQVIVVLTDGYTPWPDRKPKQKVIIGVIGSDGMMDSLPVWARGIHIE